MNLIILYYMHRWSDQDQCNIIDARCAIEGIPAEENAHWIRYYPNRHD